MTETKFTSDAILHLLGWDYLTKGSLNELIDNSGLPPITCLTTLTKAEKQHLLNKRIVLCKEICENQDLLGDLQISDARKEKVLKEGRSLCSQLDHNRSSQMMHK